MTFYIITSIYRLQLSSVIYHSSQYLRPIKRDSTYCLMTSRTTSGTTTQPVQLLYFVQVTSPTNITQHFACVKYFADTTQVYCNIWKSRDFSGCIKFISVFDILQKLVNVKCESATCESATYFVAFPNVHEKE